MTPLQESRRRWVVPVFGLCGCHGWFPDRQNL